MFASVLLRRQVTACRYANISVNNAVGMTMASYSTLHLSRVGKNNSIAHVEFNRPDKGNAMNPTFFKEVTQMFQEIGKDTTYRAVVVSARGKYFSVGLDLKESEIVPAESASKDVARKAYAMYQSLQTLHEMMDTIEKCPQPVIFCMHSVCIGGVIDLACAADIRYCSKDTWFSIKEVDIGLAADLGTLQRFQKVVGSQSLVRELCYTARKFYAEEAKSCGFVTDVLDTQAACIEKGMNVAEEIASKSPVAILGTKVVLNFSRDHSVADGLKFQSAWNAAMNQTDDIQTAVVASMSKGAQPDFSKL